MRKFIWIFLLTSLVSCSKDDFEPIPPKKINVDVFNLSENVVNDGDEVLFTLPHDSTYVLRLIDKSNGQTISKERIQGKVGVNKMKIHTKSVQTKYLFLVLEGINKNQINKTTIIVN